MQNAFHTGQPTLEDLLSDLQFDFKFPSAYMPEGDGDGDGGNDADDGSADDSGDSDDSDAGSADDDTDKSQTAIKDAEKKRLSDEAAKYRREKRDLEKQLKTLQDKDKTELDRLKEEAENVPKLQTRLSDLQIENAFLKAASKFKVKDIETVQLLAARDKDVQVEDNEVVGIEEAIEKIKKNKPFLFESEGKDDNSDADDDEKHGASGRQTNRKKGDDGKVDRDALKKKYPALRR